ncbi:hypothetical protein BaRGS_00037962 [Batillaria attramentaria]|uniref:Uncharacterized protein n=1 Tax=Batillaria attramentaria TaxID=370345 RepID=A0ABD0J777_9CAEN
MVGVLPVSQCIVLINLIGILTDDMSDNKNPVNDHDFIQVSPNISCCWQAAETELKTAAGTEKAPPKVRADGRRTLLAGEKYHCPLLQAVESTGTLGLDIGTGALRLSGVRTELT